MTPDKTPKMGTCPICQGDGCNFCNSTGRVQEIVLDPESYDEIANALTIVIDDDGIYKRLVEKRLANDVERPSDGQRIRYSTFVMVGEANVTEDGVQNYILYPRHDTAQGRRQLETTLRGLFADCRNVTIRGATKPIKVGSVLR